MQDLKKHFGAGERIHTEMINGYDKHQYPSQVIECYDSGILDILTPVHKSRIVYFSNDSIIKITSAKGEAIYEIKAQVLEKTFGQIPMMRVKVISELNKIQRRDFYRLRTILDVSVRRVINLNEKKFGERFKGVALDLSAGGLLLNTSFNIDENDLLEITLQLPIEKDLSPPSPNEKYKILKETPAPTFTELIVTGKVVRKQYNSAVKTAYEYGIKFERISDFERNTVTKFIFDEQRKLIKKGLV